MNIKTNPLISTVCFILLLSQTVFAQDFEWEDIYVKKEPGDSCVSKIEIKSSKAGVYSRTCDNARNDTITETVKLNPKTNILEIQGVNNGYSFTKDGDRLVLELSNEGNLTRYISEPLTRTIVAQIVAHKIRGDYSRLVEVEREGAYQSLLFIVNEEMFGQLEAEWPEGPAYFSFAYERKLLYPVGDGRRAYLLKSFMSVD